MGEIGPRRTAVFIGQEPKLYFYDASFLRKIGLLRKESVLRTGKPVTNEKANEIGIHTPFRSPFLKKG